MITTTGFAWGAIKGWGRLGLEHHAEVAAYVEADRKISEYIAESQPQLPSLADPENIVEAIEAHAEHIALREWAQLPTDSGNLEGADQCRSQRHPCRTGERRPLPGPAHRPVRCSCRGLRQRVGQTPGEVHRG